MSFNQFQLDARLSTGIDRAGFSTPTPIQTETIPLAMTGQDLIGTAQTGTGKTAAFVLPILHRLLTTPGKGHRVLVLTPTRELAQQIDEHIVLLSAETGIHSATIYGGVPIKPQIQALKRGVDIIVACPGRLLDHIRQKTIRLDSLDVLVLDEADRMFDMGFLPDLKRIFQHLPENRQTMLFSATFPPEVERLASQTLRSPRRIKVGHDRPVQTVTHALYPVSRYMKTRFLLALLHQARGESVLIFTRTKHRARRLALQIGREGYRVTCLHSDRTQSQRQSALEGFKKGTFPIMVATDIASRGLDIEAISHVINYDIPDTTEAYIHRIGRTGRAERTGDAYTLVTVDDLPMIHELERILGSAIERKRLEGFDYDSTHGTTPELAQEGAKEVSALMGGGQKKATGRSIRSPRRRSRFKIR
ncbi:MAG TPA: DEAD/DEAH box helicase [Thermoanaerobaculia bacterium]|nr:DEAD/DEAH box helicase [Thermoanaerobaculia bacterium]HUM29618.1 DEAD/DEAH box helicase [Thermoanaerobaculia bacterium]HXK67269.1 DEAD/DEAH box helicase [Thermoanaerobaculia bacterium]